MAYQAINQDMKDLCDIIYDWLKPISYDMKDTRGLWLDTASAPGFEWTLINDEDSQGPCVGLVPCEDDDKKIKGYNIYNYFCDFHHVNIIIRGDVVTWWEYPYTEYRDFTRTQMYSLYEKILAYYQNRGNTNEETIEEQLRIVYER